MDNNNSDGQTCAGDDEKKEEDKGFGGGELLENKAPQYLVQTGLCNYNFTKCLNSAGLIFSCAATLHVIKFLTS